MMPVISFIVRQFFLPNPFTPLGSNADAINLLFGGVLVPITYGMVGFIYDSGSDPTAGSFLFLLIYAINTGVTYLVCKAYPIQWLMGLIVVLYIALYTFIVIKVRNDY